MEQIRIQTAQNVGIAVEVAGIGDRVLAAMIDYFILLWYVLFISLIYFYSESTALYVVLFIPFFAYFLLCEVFLNGQSVGKRIRNIKVARLDGSQPTLANYLLRWLLRPIEIDMTTGMIAFVTLLLNDKGQRLGDMAAGTTVIRVKPRVRLQDTVFTDVDASYTPTFPQADMLTQEDLTMVKDVLETLRYEGRSHLSDQLSRQLKASLEVKMGTQSDLIPIHFLQTIIKDYNHLKGNVEM